MPSRERGQCRGGRAAGGPLATVPRRRPALASAQPRQCCASRSAQQLFWCSRPVQQAAASGPRRQICSNGLSIGLLAVGGRGCQCSGGGVGGLGKRAVWTQRLVVTACVWDGQRTYLLAVRRSSAPRPAAERLSPGEAAKPCSILLPGQLEGCRA